MYIYIYYRGVFGVLCMVVRVVSEQSNPIQYTLKMGCSASSVYTQYSTDAITSKQS